MHGKFTFLSGEIGSTSGPCREGSRTEALSRKGWKRYRTLRGLWSPREPDWGPARKQWIHHRTLPRLRQRAGRQRSAWWDRSQQTA